MHQSPRSPSTAPIAPALAHRRRLAALLASGLVLAGCVGGAETDAELAARGQPLYEAACVQCHGGPSGGTISDLPPRHNAEGHTWHHADCLLTDIVLDGLPPRPGAEGDEVMPAFREELTDEEVAAIIAYVKTWWTEEQREVQAEVTAAECDDG